MDTQLELPKTQRALVQHAPASPPQVDTVPVPEPTPGSAIVQILRANVIAYSRDIYNGVRKYPYPTPLVIGSSALGRIAAVGSDATSLRPGQLVRIDPTVRGRDDPTAIFLSGVHEGHTDGGRKLMRGDWRDSTYAQYAKVPLENCDVLDEKRLLGKVDEGGLGYQLEELAFISGLLVPFGGLSDISLRPGETIIVAPATGYFGGAAVQVALAMGARVIAMGRNAETLERVVATMTRAYGKRITAVRMTGDVQADTAALLRENQGRPVDAYFDISPPAAGESTHIKSGILALRNGGRVSLMGGIGGDVAIPHLVVMHRNLMIKGRWMYEPGAGKQLIKMVETGVLKLGESGGMKVSGTFGLDEWEKAFDNAANTGGLGVITLIAP